MKAPYDAVHQELGTFIPAVRLVTDPLRLLAWGTDASFYRLIPQIVAVVESEDEVRRLLQTCSRHGVSVTFRAAGTSLAGQSISDSVLVMLGDNWRGIRISPDKSTISLQSGLIGAAANRALAGTGRKIGPDPASIDTALIGGMVANNASGMCCGTKENSYSTIAGARVVLADGTVLDTRDPASRAAFAKARPDLFQGLADLGAATRANETLAARIRHKFRMKNTTGYGLNSLVDFTDPVDILTHLMVGSEGTLAFLSEVTYFTVEDHAFKASALMLFDTLENTCSTVSRLKHTPVAAVELLDRPSLRAVENKAGMPAALRALPPEAAALLVEVRAETAAALAIKLEAVSAVVDAAQLATPLRFTSDAAETAALWNVRKGVFPAVGAVRPTGTTVIIEDVAFPVERLAEAVLDLQRLLSEFNYPEAIIYGHALDGNMHFVFTQDFSTPAEIDRYRRFMDVVCDMVVKKYDGALKAEHGTGRNMAPFVELEWGKQAYETMKRIKTLFDPTGLLNPGVIINPDPQSHLKNLKPMPAADEIVDKCIECGFCEPKCPSRGLTLTPRQRTVGWREISHLEATGSDPARLAALKPLYDYMGIETCAACGMCATACPVAIDTGYLIKKLRGQKHGALAHKVAETAAGHFGGLTAGVRLGLGSADLLHATIGTSAMKGLMSGLRKASGGAIPKWTPALARPVHFVAPAVDAARRAERVVYFPSCAARNMGAPRGQDKLEPLPTVTQRLFERAGFDVAFPRGMDGMCCGQPFESKGLPEQADSMSAQLEAALRDASEGGKYPIVFDTSACAYRMKKYVQGRLPILDSVEFLHDVVMPRVPVKRQAQPVAVHPLCTVRKMGNTDKLSAIASRCAEQVVIRDDVLCCGFAGDRGFSQPELNEHALRHMRAQPPVQCAKGYSTSRTCEIGLTENSGIPFQSIIYLVEERAAAAAAEPAAAPAPVSAKRVAEPTT